jgi:hypothetical protein
MNPRRLVPVLLVLCMTSPLGAQRGGRDDPSPVIRSLVQAMYANDVAAYNKLTLPHPLRSRLTSGGRVNESGLKELKDDPGGLQIKMKRPFEFRGKEAKPGSGGQYPVGTTAHYVVSHRGGPMVMGLVRQPDGWKVDLRWWIAMTDMMAGKEPAKDSPDFAIKSMLMAMLQLDRREAAGFITDARGLDLLFDGAPRQREPSGVMEASVAEMPIVEIGSGEFTPLPTGGVVEGVQTAERKVLVGWFGPIELPFVVRRAGGAWKVEPQPYFALMEQ